MFLLKIEASRAASAASASRSIDAFGSLLAKALRRDDQGVIEGYQYLGDSWHLQAFYS